MMHCEWSEYETLVSNDVDITLIDLREAVTRLRQIHQKDWHVTLHQSELEAHIVCLTQTVEALTNVVGVLMARVDGLSP